MNDIELVKTGQTFDWNFTNTDVANVTGKQRIISAVIHAVMLHKGELEQIYYQTLGCDGYNHTKLLQNENTLSIIKGDVETACKNIDGVRDAQADVEFIDNGCIIHSIAISLEQGGGVTVGF